MVRATATAEPPTGPASLIASDPYRLMGIMHDV